MGKKILLYGYGPEQDRMLALLARLKIEARVISAEERDSTIGELCDSEKEPVPGEAEPAELPLMIFSDFTREELDEVLTASKKEGITVKSLKAMVTPTNRSWTIRALSEEIAEEHRVMGALMELKKLRDPVGMPDFRNVPLMSALMQADTLLSGQQEVTFVQVQRAYRNLQAALR